MHATDSVRRDQARPGPRESSGADPVEEFRLVVEARARGDSKAVIAGQRALRRLGWSILAISPRSAWGRGGGQ